MDTHSNAQTLCPLQSIVGCAEDLKKAEVVCATCIGASGTTLDKAGLLILQAGNEDGEACAGDLINFNCWYDAELQLNWSLTLKPRQGSQGKMVKIITSLGLI